METIRQLPEQFTGTGEVKGYEFTQICKTERAFCYEVSLGGTITHFEVFLRKINNRFGCVSYPTSKAFGIRAWTVRTKEEAMKKIKEVSSSRGKS